MQKKLYNNSILSQLFTYGINLKFDVSSWRETAVPSEKKQFPLSFPISLNFAVAI